MTDLKHTSGQAVKDTEADTTTTTSSLQEKHNEWCDSELVRIAQGDPLMDATEFEALKAEGKSRGLSLRIGPLSDAVKDLRRKANLAEYAETGQSKYDAFIERMNTTYFIYTCVDDVRICSWSIQHNRRILVQRKVQDFRTLLANEPQIIVPSSGDKLTAAEAWIRDPNRREVKGFCFEPDPEKAEKLLANGFENLFEGFAVEPKSGSIDPFLQHLQEVIVAEEAPHRHDLLINYLLDCFAHLVQRPGVPLRVALVFRGRQGSGKSFLTETIKALFCGNTFETSRAEDLVGQFTDHLLNTCLVIGDEALFAGSKKEADAMKSLITQDTLRIEGKHKAILNHRNRLSMMLTSNHEHAVRLEPGERRYFVCDTSDARTPRADHPEYWDDLWAWAKSEEGKAALLNFLLERDLTNFDAQRDRPHTKARLDQILASLDPVYQWYLQELIERKGLPREITSAEISEDDLSEVTAQNLVENIRMYKKRGFYEAFSKWERENLDGRRYLNEKLFWKSLRGILGDQLIGKKRVKGEPTHVVELPCAIERARLFMSAIGCTDLGIDVLDVAADKHTIQPARGSTPDIVTDFVLGNRK